MNLIKNLNEWSSQHHPKWLVVLRVVLGLLLFLKGIQFIQNSTLIGQMISESPSLQNFIKFQTVIPWLHLLGGLLIILGLFTRIASLVQVPILLAAIIFVNAKKGVFAGESDLLFSIVILILLIVFIIEGGGPFSLDNRRRKQKLLEKK